jgi:alpha-beta hydrolase superfamily lysophospholipase
MKHEEYSWKSFDGLAMFAQSWSPQESPRAVVALVHGQGDHSGRYPRLVQRLVESGYAVNAMDNRGHGKSGGPRAHAPSMSALMNDIDAHLDQARTRLHGLPLFLYGHSFGGEQVLYYGLVRKPRLNGVIASSPLLGSGIHQPAAKVFAAKMLSRIVPQLTLAHGTPPASLSHDQSWVESSLRDPFFQSVLSVRTAAEVLRASAWIRSHTSFPVPLLVEQGTDDLYVSPSMTIAFARGLSGDVTLKVWEGLGHELHNETRKDEVIDTIIAWMDEHVR